MKKLFLIFCLITTNAYAAPLSDSEVIKVLKCQGVIQCRGSDSYGGPCYAGYGGPLYDGYGGACYAGYGGPLYDGYGGPLYAGYGGPLYDGYGGGCYTGYNGACDSNSKTELPLVCSTLCQ